VRPKIEKLRKRVDLDFQTVNGGKEDFFPPFGKQGGEF
jgi:hypothetical protein